MLSLPSIYECYPLYIVNRSIYDIFYAESCVQCTHRQIGSELPYSDGGRLVVVLRVIQVSNWRRIGTTNISFSGHLFSVTSIVVPSLVYYQRQLWISIIDSVQLSAQVSCTQKFKLLYSRWCKNSCDFYSCQFPIEGRTPFIVIILPFILIISC